MRRFCGLTQKARVVPNPGDRGVSPSEGGHCRRPAAGGKRGQDTKVSCPLLRLPNFPLAATPFGRAAKVRGTQLKPRYHRRLFDAVWGWLRARFPRMTVRGSGAKGDKQLSGTLRRAGCPHPAAPSERYFPSGPHPAALSERYWHSGGSGRVNRCGSTYFYTKKWRYPGFQVSP